MRLNAPVSLTCPTCQGQFLDNARLVRPGGSVWCPHCEALFRLDDTDQTCRTMLADARTARRRRKQRLAELNARWSDAPGPTPAATPAPMLMSDVLVMLDDLLLRLDGLARKSN